MREWWPKIEKSISQFSQEKKTITETRKNETKISAEKEKSFLCPLQTLEEGRRQGIIENADDVGRRQSGVGSGTPTSTTTKHKEMCKRVPSAFDGTNQARDRLAQAKGRAKQAIQNDERKTNVLF